jgi:hypothetical protein
MLPAAMLTMLLAGSFTSREGHCDQEESKRRQVDANGIQLDGNLPTEDRLLVKHLANLKDAFYLGVFDGHSGW